MINWREYPFVRLLLPLTLGILCSIMWTIKVPYFIIIFLSLPIVCLTYFKVQFKYRYVYGFFITLFFFTLGNFLSYHADETRRADHYHHFLNAENEMVATITNIRKTANSYRAELSVHSVSGVEDGQHVTGKLLSYFEQSNEDSKM